MEKTPEKNKKKSSKSRGGTKIFRQILTVLFAICICAVSYMVYNAITYGIGLPVSSVGKTLTQATQISTPAATEPDEEDTTQAPTVPLEPEELAKLCFDSMSLEEKVWQMIFVTPQDLNDANGKQNPVGGVYFTPDDLSSRSVLSAEMRAVQDASSTPVLFGVAEEGGSVSPLSALELTDAVAAMSTYGASGDPNAVYKLGQSMAEQILDAGFHFNLAPVADTVNWYPRDVGDRSFSTDVNVAAQMVAEMVKGAQEKGMISCLKHFPNLGSTGQSNEYDISWRLASDFEGTDFIPFKAGIDADVEMVLVSNMMAPDLTGGTYMPCCLSENVVTNILRKDLGFNGLILSDDQRGQLDGATFVSIVKAGCDVVFLPANPQVAVDAIMEAIENGTLTQERIEESVWRILLLKCEYGVITQ